jgi:hypothetical protein
MFSPPNTPNNFPPPQGQELQEEKKTLTAEILSSIALRVFIILLTLFIAWTIIQEISGVGGWFGGNVMDWFNEASINPKDEKGFTYFLRLLLTAGFIGIVITFLKNKSGGSP